MIAAVVPVVLSLAKVVWTLAPIARKIHAALGVDSDGGKQITPAEWREILGGTEADEALDNVNALGRRKARKGKRRGGK